jgi:CheY-like chemotaxis protein
LSSTVLVVDDDDDIRLLVRTTLSSDGYRVLESATGTGGLELARQDRPDLILLDLHVPDLDAWSFLIRAWDDGRTGKIPVVMFSAANDTAAAERALAWGCRAYLPKPFSVDELLATISRALGTA